MNTHIWFIVLCLPLCPLALNCYVCGNQYEDCPAVNLSHIQLLYCANISRWKMVACGKLQVKENTKILTIRRCLREDIADACDNKNLKYAVLEDYSAESRTNSYHKYTVLDCITCLYDSCNETTFITPSVLTGVCIVLYLLLTTISCTCLNS
ncbi:hypothetical protein C0J52_20883 [Blattella germanica]|nr:hypothetical protein C0J52_20883 [Blattella germanica]